MAEVSLDKIAQAFGMSTPQVTEHHVLGVVSSVSGNKATVTLDGASGTVEAASIQTVAANDRVLCLVKDGSVYVLGAF